MSRNSILKHSREALQAQLKDSDTVSDAWIDFTELLTIATSMESDLMWAYNLCDIALKEYPEMHEGLKTQLEGFRDYYQQNY